MLNSKILSLSSLKRKLPPLRKQGRIIAFTNGCFDIIHAGHVRYLDSAKRKNRVLIVGLNSDSSVCKIKGAERPIVCQEDRALVLAAFSSVDYVVIFQDETPLALINEIKPDVLIKGADWKAKGVVGADVVEAYGGHIEYVPFVENRSSTNIINKIARGLKTLS